jgi:multidrug transporter EmrE-like cation transporter
VKPQYIALVVALLANAFANILIKSGMKSKEIGLSDPLTALKQIITNPLVIAGVGLFALNIVAYSYVLSKIQLSIAYPIMTSVGFLIVVGFSVFALKEQVSLVQVIGIVMIVTGVVLVAGKLD